MEKVKKTRVSHLNLDSSKRMIFMSDIHGDVKLFKESLAGVNFSNDDYLFVINFTLEVAKLLFSKILNKNHILLLLNDLPDEYN